MEHLVTTGEMDGTHSSGRPRERGTEGMVQWKNIGRDAEMLKITKETQGWRDMIAHAARHGFT